MFHEVVILNRPRWQTCRGLKISKRAVARQSSSICLVFDKCDKCVPKRYIQTYKQQRQTLKTVQPNSFSKTPITIRVNLIQFGPSLPSFVFAV